jgi:hypothetical protein
MQRLIVDALMAPGTHPEGGQYARRGDTHYLPASEVWVIKELKRTVSQTAATGAFRHALRRLIQHGLLDLVYAAYADPTSGAVTVRQNWTSSGGADYVTLGPSVQSGVQHRVKTHVHLCQGAKP